MTTVSVLEFRKDAEGVIRRLQRGQRLILSYRGKAVARMEPIPSVTLAAEDPIYSLATLATAKGASMTNAEMDQAIYEA